MRSPVKLHLLDRTWQSFLNFFRTWTHPVFDADELSLEEVEETDDHATEPNTAMVPSPITDDKTMLFASACWLYVRIGREEVYWELPLEAGSLLHIAKDRKDVRYSKAVVHRYDEGDN